jgi:hypothetical protein
VSAWDAEKKIRLPRPTASKRVPVRKNFRRMILNSFLRQRGVGLRCRRSLLHRFLLMHSTVLNYSTHLLVDNT